MQKKRQKNRQIFELLGSLVSQRRTARLLHLNRKTVARRLKFLGARSNEELYFQTASSPVTDMQFDDLETHVHTKYKPVSVIIAVESKTRRILGFRLASMPAKGMVSKKAFCKYGPRLDERRKYRRQLFEELRPVVQPGAILRSDSNPHYVDDVKEFFPEARHIRVIGGRGSTSGQGELKQLKFDPIFSLNHTCAMLRANVSPLIRKTWCTSKKLERLADHLAIYAVYHNQNLKLL
jgi:hypothetical protein